MLNKSLVLLPIVNGSIDPSKLVSTLNGRICEIVYMSGEPYMIKEWVDHFLTSDNNYDLIVVIPPSVDLRSVTDHLNTILIKYKVI